MGAFETFNENLANIVVGAIGPEGQQRLAALISARSAMPNSDVYDRIRLARYVLTGSENEPALPEVEEVKNVAGGTVVRMEKRTQTEDYPFPSGEVMVLGPEIFASSPAPYDEGVVINWRGRNFVPKQELAGPDPAFEEAVAEREPAPSAGEHWQGRRGGPG